jgi:hypothetical protein
MHVLLKKNTVVEILTIGFLSGLIFWFMINHVTDSDIQMHAELLHYFHEGTKTFPPNFLYYLFLELFSGFSGNLNSILVASGIVLALALTAKYFITKKIILDFIEIRNLDLSEKQRRFISIGLAGSLLLLFAIPDSYTVFTLHKYYLGRVVPNIWHNSTTITVFPFALYLFWTQYKLLISNKIASPKQLMGLSLLVVLNCLIKPSFIFVYIPVTGLFLLSKFGFKHFLSLLKHCIPLVLGLIVIIALQFLIFQLQLGLLQESPSKVVLVAPFKIWEFLIPKWYIPYSLLLSYTFPLCFFLLFPKAIFKDRLLGYTVLLVFFGLLISIFIGEEGARAHHGNFLWQNFICCFMLMMTVSLSCLEKRIKGELLGWKWILLTSIYILHLLAGLGYFLHMGIFGTYD